ncbi:5-formyltetrahydrofolate cyclo-ligase [Aquamicrobium terrae]|uniref:5-formyltetrahydrofolate cyclo-ligase n=1 Tax=Aquamicrobium terrae TaxID=1324945 RepID=A0ABV2N109_9HYPH
MAGKGTNPIPGRPDGAPSELSQDISQWRVGERKRLIGLRLAMSADERASKTRAIAAGLDRLIGSPQGRIVSLYWPFRGEPDLREWSTKIIEAGGQIALPVVIAKAQPLEFRLWAPGEPLERGVWNILVPSSGRVVEPDVVVAPVVGFDAANYRLGYGGGFYDRTLAAMTKRPFKVGVGYAGARLATIHPHAQDIAMDAIVTDERGSHEH